MLRISRTLNRAQPALTRAIHQSTPKTNPSPLLSTPKSAYTSMKVANLKDECRKRGLRLSGRKADLVERLSAHDYSTVKDRLAASATPNPVAAPALSPNPNPNPSTLTRVRLISSSAPTLAQGDSSTIDFCKLPHTALPADAPRVKIPTSPDAYGEVARYGTHAITNDRKVAEAVAEDELHSKQPQEIHYASGHVVRSFTGDHSSESGGHEFSTNDKLVLGGIVGAVGFWWWLGVEGKVE